MYCIISVLKQESCKATFEPFNALLSCNFVNLLSIRSCNGAAWTAVNICHLHAIYVFRVESRCMRLYGLDDLTLQLKSGLTCELVKHYLKIVKDFLKSFTRTAWIWQSVKCSVQDSYFLSCCLAFVISSKFAFWYLCLKATLWNGHIYIYAWWSKCIYHFILLQSTRMLT